jgi:glycosyltransferase involved in cell wall biosynthesis
MGRKRTGTAVVVKACERLHRKFGNIFLLLYDTPLSAEGERRIRDFTCKVPFQFVINHPVERNYELFGRADAFAGAEKKGGWSNCTAEALACGVPAVATRAGTLDFLVDGETGLLVRRNSFSIARGLGKLYRDAQLRKRLAAAGRERIRGFAWEPLASRILDFLGNQE